MVERNLADVLKLAVQGDANAMADILQADHASVMEAVKLVGAPLVVKRADAIGVVQRLVDGRSSPSAVQAWASFVRRGFVGRAAGGRVQPIDVEFEQASEDAISAVVSRLDEIGDVIDGEITIDEAIDLLQLLGQY